LRFVDPSGYECKETTTTECKDGGDNNDDEGKPQVEEPEVVEVFADDNVPTNLPTRWQRADLLFAEMKAYWNSDDGEQDSEYGGGDDYWDSSKVSLLGDYFAHEGVFSSTTVEGGAGAGATLGVKGKGLAVPNPFVLALALTGSSHKSQKLYVTYTRVGPNGQVYSGRTSGTRMTVDQILARRYAGQKHLTAAGFAYPVLDQVSLVYKSIRGREQQLIDFHGGAVSVGGTSRNLINGIADLNPLRSVSYMSSANVEFGGPLPDNSPERFRL